MNHRKGWPLPLCIIVGVTIWLGVIGACKPQERPTHKYPSTLTTTTAPAPQGPPEPPLGPAGAGIPNTAPTWIRSCDDIDTPITRGQPGYRPGLDRDGDGIACD